MNFREFITTLTIDLIKFALWIALYVAIAFALIEYTQPKPRPPILERFFVCTMQDGVPQRILFKQYHHQPLCPETKYYQQDEDSGGFSLIALPDNVWQLEAHTDGMGDPYVYQYRIENNGTITPLATWHNGNVARMMAYLMAIPLWLLAYLWVKFGFRLWKRAFRQPENLFLKENQMTISLPRGAVMADVAAYELTADEIVRLQDPAVGGVILFRRNFQNVAQLKKLCSDIKNLRTPELIIAVDHEGGRVQRFIDGFTRLPAMNVLGEMWDNQSPEAAQSAAEQIGWVLATELAACGVDLSFTPVLDLDWGQCAVIGNRSLHRQPEIVVALALALQRGLNRGGMKSCGKHFPGHGFVEGDSHHVLPEDTREFSELEQQDIAPFAALAKQGMAAVMPAHVVYPKVDAQPAGFSSYWLKTILREKLGFDGVIFSDDLTMEGASVAGGIRERAALSFEAGCDIVLVCNRPDLVDELRQDFRQPENDKLAERWQNMACTISRSQAAEMMRTAEFAAAQALTAQLATPKDLAGGVKVGEAF